MPYPRNPFFTGRQTVLAQVHERLQSGAVAINQAQAIYGLGGIGKTQTAVEYAYRYFDDEPVYDWVFWVRADTQLNLQTDVAELAKPLGLAAANAPDLDDRIRAVLNWLETETGWLLVFDNADQPELLKPLMPRNGRGRVLITSRAAAFDMVGVRQPLPLDTLDRSEAVDFLFKRVEKSQGNAAVEEVEAATNLAEALGDLPLALEQAGAFILRRKLSFSVYLNQYYKQRLRLLEREMPKTGDYPASVLTTWQLNFEAVAEASPAAADLLRLSAFVAPDEIPYELLWQGREQWSEPLQTALAGEGDDFLFNLFEVLEPLTQYSLIRLEPEINCYSIHRMVQEALRDQMDGSEIKIWVEQVVEGVNKAFPLIDSTTWERSYRLLPHAISTIHSADREGYASRDIWRLLHQVSFFLEETGQYFKAQKFCEKALKLSTGTKDVKPIAELNPLYTASSMHLLSSIYLKQDKIQEAKFLLDQELNIREMILRVDDSNEEDYIDYASCLDSLSAIYIQQGSYEIANSLCQDALNIRESLLPESHSHIATSLMSLSKLLRIQKDLDQAEQLCKRAVRIRKSIYLGAHPDLAYGFSDLSLAESINGLSLILEERGRYSEAALLCYQALEMQIEFHGRIHPDVAIYLNSLAGILLSQGRFDDAEYFYKESIDIKKEIWGESHTEFAIGLDNLARVYCLQSRYDQAEKSCIKAMNILKSIQGSSHPDTLIAVSNLADIYNSSLQFQKAEILYVEIVRLNKKENREHYVSSITNTLKLASTYRRQNKLIEAERLCLQTLDIMRDYYDEKHYLNARIYNNLGVIKLVQENFEDAFILLDQAIEIALSNLENCHLDVVDCTGNLIQAYIGLKRYHEAEQKCLKILDIGSQSLAFSHPSMMNIMQTMLVLVEQVLADGQESILSDHPLIQRIAHTIKSSS